MKKAIFLDIDGVLQPFTQHRFKHDMEALKVRLAQEHGNDHFLSLFKYDVAAVFYDWWRPAVKYLHILCGEMGAVIVLSSAWRSGKTVEDMRVMMSIHDLGKYLVDFTPDLDYPYERADEIRAYLNGHPEVEHFVAIDDAYISGYKREFPGNYVATHSRMEREHFEQAARILTGNPVPWFKTHLKKVFFLHPDSLVDADEKSTWESPKHLSQRLAESDERILALKPNDVWNIHNRVNRYAAYMLPDMLERFEVAVVVPASWSKKYDLEQLKLLLSLADERHNIGGYVLELTPRHRKGAGNEIQAYLRKHPQIEHFVVGENTPESPLYEMFPGRVVNWKRSEKALHALQRREDDAYLQARLLLAGGEPIEENHQVPGFFERYDR